MEKIFRDRTFFPLKWNICSMHKTRADGGPIDSVDGNIVNMVPSAVATLSLDVVLSVDSRGLSAVFLSLRFDSDLRNAVDLLYWEELPFAQVNSKGVTTASLLPFTVGIISTIESSGTQAGRVYGFEATTTGLGPSNTTLAFARLVFRTNHGRISGKPDIFSDDPENLFLDNTGADITGSVSFGDANVFLPEPTSAALLGLGLGAFALAARRSGNEA